MIGPGSDKNVKPKMVMLLYSRKINRGRGARYIYGGRRHWLSVFFGDLHLWTGTHHLRISECFHLSNLKWTQASADCNTSSQAIFIHNKYSTWGKVSWKKVAVLLDFVQITSPLPLLPIWITYKTFFNAKNVDLSNIQNNSLSKILLKLRQNTCFEGHVYNLKTV